MIKIKRALSLRSGSGSGWFRLVQNEGWRPLPQGGGAAQTSEGREGGAVPVARGQRDRRVAQLSKLSKIRVVRKSVDRVLTVIHQTQKESLRKFYRGKRCKPLDLRPKKTHAMRRGLHKHEENLKSKKQPPKEWPYPLRQ